MWVPLHVHSQYSILDASASVKGIAEKAASFGMPAVALTDHGNMFGVVEFFKACKSAGVKPILGCEVYVAPQSRFHKKGERGERTAHHLTLLAKNDQGYHNLCKLSSIGYLEGFYYRPRIDREVLEEYCEGLICLSGCMSSHVSQEALDGSRESLLQVIDWYQNIFGEDYYLELQRATMSEEDLHAEGMYQESWLHQLYQETYSKREKINQALLEAGR
ncbi:MAG: PHP domain-containing protein, partial [Waddliaceae bacterium]